MKLLTDKRRGSRDRLDLGVEMEDENQPGWRLVSCDKGRFLALVPLMCGRFRGPLASRMGALHNSVMEGPEATTPSVSSFLSLNHWLVIFKGTCLHFLWVCIYVVHAFEGQASLILCENAIQCLFYNFFSLWQFHKCFCKRERLNLRVPNHSLTASHLGPIEIKNSFL